MRYFILLMLSTVAFLVTFSISQLDKDRDNFNLFSTIENILIDLRFNFREGEIRSFDFQDNLALKETKIMTIDGESLNRIGKWPWKRNVHAEFLNKIQRFSPRMIHIDILFNLEEELSENLGDQSLNQQFNLDEFNLYLGELDSKFARELEKHENVYIDQYLLFDRLPIYDEEYLNRLTLNEEILAQNSLDPIYKVERPLYINTEPLVGKFLVNATPVVVNAVPDRDEVLRKATLVYPYRDSRGDLHYLASVYLQLAKRYYSISSEDIKIYEKYLVLENSIAPDLNEATRNPLIEVVDFDEFRGKVKAFRQKKYDANLYRLFLILYSKRYKDDTLKIPDYPLRVLANPDGSYELLEGKEIFDAAGRLGSKKIKIISHKKQNIVVPLTKNKEDNPYSLFINYANREDLAVSDSEGNTKTEYFYPLQSYSSVYLSPSLPDLPEVEVDNDQIGDITTAELLEWFNAFVKEKNDEIIRDIFKSFGTIEEGLIFDYALNENPYEGAFFFYNLFLNEYQQTFNEEDYVGFITSFFEQNNLDPNHPLINDYSLSKNVLLDFLTDEYLANYNDFYNKVLFVGAFSTGMARDVHKTTYDEMFGVTTILSAFDTIIQQNFLIQPPDQITYLSLAFLCISFSFGYYFLTNYLKYLSFFFMNIIILLASFYLFENNYLFDTTLVLFANLFVFISITLYVILYEEKDKKYLKEIFSNYLAPEVIDSMYKSKQSIKLGGDERNITAFFTDIQGFSSFSEILTADQLVELLNEYLGAMTDILLAQGGTLDKYEGDAIIAFYGAPLDMEDSAFKACEAALLMQDKLLELRKKWSSEKSNDPNRIKKKLNSPDDWNKGDKWPKLVHNMKMRIGINSGLIVVGNMGSRKRKNYTMMGDDVNLAARLESSAKQYGIFTVVSNNSFDQKWVKDGQEVTTRDFFSYRLVDEVVVMGKKKSVSLYEIFCLKGKESERQKKLIENFNQAREFFVKGDFESARDFFQKANEWEENPYQRLTPSKVFIERCEKYIAEPQTINLSDWTGVHVLGSK